MPSALQSNQPMRNSWLIAGTVMAVLTLLPFVLNQLGRTGEYWLWVATEMVIMSLFSLSLNLILGFGGMVSFGHAAFFGVGAYTVALLMKKAGVGFLPAMVAAPLASALVAGVIGWFCVRRVGLYFSILTLAFGQLLFMITLQLYAFTGGDDGIHGIPRPEMLTPLSYYLVCLALVAGSFWLMRLLTKSPFGLTIRMTRENPERAKFLGINVKRYQLINFIIASAFAGLAGGLFAELNRFAQTEYLHWSKSAEPIFASLVGGMYSLIGPAIGSTVLIFLKIIIQQIHQGLVEIWAIILGVILLGMVLFAPEGIVGVYEKIRCQRRRQQ
ncbi:MAG: branched-chain amino acid ABC transporter permease [Deltaproteobacteria bacterium]|nr:branched-chain amino acid ABC transporter permease [Deltaproteobacteria bacterium]